MGEAGTGDGEGVLANGDTGTWPIDFLLFGDRKFLTLDTLWLMTCRDEGRWWRVEEVAGELGTEEEGEEEAEELAGDWSIAVGGCGDLQRVGDATLASPAETVRVRD